MEIGFNNVDLNFTTLLLSIILAYVSARIAVSKNLKFLREMKLRDRYWNYLKVLSSKEKSQDLRQQTYNICLFAKNKKIADKAKTLLHQRNISDEEIDKLISLMRKDLGL